MDQQQALFTSQAISCLKNSNRIAISHNKKIIQADDLFLGIYGFIRQHQYFSIFCNITGLKNIETLDEYYQNRYGDFSVLSFETKTLNLNAKIKKEIQELTKSGFKQTDFIILFYISILNLSTTLKKLLNKHNIDIDTPIKNCKNLIKNPIIKKAGAFAFLEILHKILTKLNLDPKDVKIMKVQNIDNIENVNMLLDAVESEIGEQVENSTINATSKKEEKKLTIEYFGTDLTRESKDGFIDPIIGRSKEIDQMIYTLLRKSKNNPLLIGEAGVGKTAIVEGLAQKITRGEVPERLKNKRLFLLDMGTLVAGTKYRGEFEARMKSILEEATDPTNNIILFIDELHTIIGAGGQEHNDAAQMLKPLLSRGKIKLIGATTFDEYQKYIEKDAALKRRFQELIVNEPDAASTKEILMGLKQTYEDFHGVQISEESVETAINLSRRYILNKYLPDKAIDILDEACARKSTMEQKLESDEEFTKAQKQITDIQVKIEEAIEKQDYFLAAELKEKEEKIKLNMQKIRTTKAIPTHLRPTILPTDIGNVLADKTGIPSNIVNEDEITKLRRLDADLKEHIVGQDEAVESVVKTLTRSRLSVINRKKPIGSFLFLGPTGVGKTYLAKLIAKNYFGDETAMIRLDMSEFMEKFSISKIIGSPAGYVGYEEGGNLTEAVRRKPYSVILFDEIEKASTEVLNIMLQILDEGQLKDSKGRLIDFKSTIIIMTSNIGSEEFTKKKGTIGFSAGGTEQEIDEKKFEDIKGKVMEELKNFLSPELLNRIDYKIVFRHLSKANFTDIFKINLQEFLATRAQNSTVELPKFTEKKIKEISEKIYDPMYGARPIERHIHDEIEPMIIKKLMEEKK
ncbi:MAG: ATP-dependent Clp protease ATP-binding subunit [Candidatus Absconditicoccaceae bacterium]